MRHLIVKNNSVYYNSMLLMLFPLFTLCYAKLRYGMLFTVIF